MKGDDLNKVTTCFTVGYLVGMIPQNLLLQFIPARTLFPANALIWGGLTMVTAAAKNTTHLMVIRFFQGIAEASTFVGAHVILGACTPLFSHTQSSFSRPSPGFSSFSPLLSLLQHPRLVAQHFVNPLPLAHRVQGVRTLQACRRFLLRRSSRHHFQRRDDGEDSLDNGWTRWTCRLPVAFHRLRAHHAAGKLSFFSSLRRTFRC